MLNRVNNIGNKYAPIKCFTSANGYGWKFNPKDMTMILVEMYRLKDAGKAKRLLWSFTIDAAVITRHMIHTTAGMKIVDPESRDPETGKLLLTNSGNSPFLCWPICMVVGKETKELFHQDFKFIFDFAAELENASEDNHPVFDGMKGFDVAVPTDKAAGWKTLLQGGGLGSTEFFAACVPVVAVKSIMQTK